MSQQKHPKNMAILILAVHCGTNFIGNHSSPRRDRGRFHLWGQSLGIHHGHEGSRNPKFYGYLVGGWTFPPLWKICEPSKWIMKPLEIGMKRKNIWNHHLDIDMYIIYTLPFYSPKKHLVTTNSPKQIRYSNIFACFSMLGPAADGFGYGLWSVQPGGH